MRHPRLFPLLFLLLSSILVDVSSSLSFNIHFSHWGYDPQEILFHKISPKFGNGSRMYTGHHDRVVLPRKRRKNFVPKPCDCSRFDGMMYARPVLLRDEAAGADEVASFKMTLCLRVDRRDQPGTTSNGGNLIRMFMFLVPYPWNRSDKGIEFGLDSTCTERDDASSSLDGDPAVVCAHVHYDSAEQLLKTNVRTGDRSCLCVSKIDRRRMPKEAAVGLASRTAGDPIKLENILTWSFYSTLESKDKDPPLLLPPHAPSPPTAGGDGARGDQRLRLDLDPWNRNAELNLRYQRNWQQLRCSISVTLGCGSNANEDTD